MDSKNRFKITVVILLLIGGALIMSFGRNLLFLNPPSVVLPDPDSVPSPSGSDQPDNSDSFRWVDVTPETVQGVIATLHRAESYYRNVSVTVFWKDFLSTIPAQIWTRDGWSYVLRFLPNGVSRYDLIGFDRHYYWYDGDSLYLTAPIGTIGADLAQQIPTYETVLELDPSSITDAGYETLDRFFCIYVEVEDAALHYRERYWIDVESGLLVSAETEKDGVIVYQLDTTAAIETPCPTDVKFHLPDGSDVFSDPLSLPRPQTP